MKTYVAVALIAILSISHVSSYLESFILEYRYQHSAQMLFAKVHLSTKFGSMHTTINAKQQKTTILEIGFKDFS